MGLMITRKMDVELNKLSELQQGDRFQGTLENGATIEFEVAKVNDETLLLVCTHTLGVDICWNEESTTKGGYHESNIRHWLNVDFLDQVPDDFRKLLVIDENDDMFRLLKKEEVFGDNCLDMMKDHNNRIALEGFNGPYSDWYWLQDVASSAYACYVGGNGTSSYTGASIAFGVRPVCLMRKQ